jgi:hypothetical protein
MSIPIYPEITINNGKFKVYSKVQVLEIIVFKYSKGG